MPISGPLTTLSTLSVLLTKSQLHTKGRNIQFTYCQGVTEASVVG